MSVLDVPVYSSVSAEHFDTSLSLSSPPLNSNLTNISIYLISDNEIKVMDREDDLENVSMTMFHCHCERIFSTISPDIPVHRGKSSQNLNTSRSIPVHSPI